MLRRWRLKRIREVPCEEGLSKKLTGVENISTTEWRFNERTKNAESAPPPTETPWSNKSRQDSKQASVVFPKRQIPSVKHCKRCWIQQSVTTLSSCVHNWQQQSNSLGERKMQTNSHHCQAVYSRYTCTALHRNDFRGSMTMTIESSTNTCPQLNLILTLLLNSTQ